MNTYVFNGLKHTGKAIVYSPLPQAPSGMLVRAPAEDSAHVDYVQTHSMLVYKDIFSFFLPLFFSSFLSFFILPSFLSSFLFLERRRSRSQVIIKIKAQQKQQTDKILEQQFPRLVHTQGSYSVTTTARLPWWCDWSEVFTHGLDNSSTPDPETHADPNASIKQQPERSWRLLHDTTLLIDQPERDERTNRIAGKTQKHRLSYKNTGNCLEWDFFSAWFFSTVHAALLWVGLTGKTFSHFWRLQHRTLIVLLFQMSLHHW